MFEAAQPRRFDNLQLSGGLQHEFTDQSVLLRPLLELGPVQTVSLREALMGRCAGFLVH